MVADHRAAFPRGIVPVVQTAFDSKGEIDPESICRLTEDAIAAGASGFLAPVVASEVSCLSSAERRRILTLLQSVIGGRVPLIAGASSDDPAVCREMAAFAEELGAAAWLVAVPQSLYSQPQAVCPWFADVVRDSQLPLIIQDLQFNGSGLSIEVIRDLQRQVPQFQGIKIETVPAGPKYTAVREAFGPDFYIAGGWAVPQMIEALDRGVDAMIPESSMVRVYQAICQHHENGDRNRALHLFRALIPVLAFTNQELLTSIAFFKRLLVRKGIFTSDTMRMSGFQWDPYNRRIAEELIDEYLRLEQQLLVCG